MSKGWYPVIDYDKCVGCMVCNDMCRHGVYKPNDEMGKPKVVYGTGCAHGLRERVTWICQIIHILLSSSGISGTICNCVIHFL